MEYLDPDIIGCVTRDGYQVSRRGHQWSHPVLRGRTRYVLKDTMASYEVDTVLQLTESQFASWQEFWNVTIKRGVDPFYMTLNLSDQLFEYPVHAVQPWSGSYTGAGLWTVSLRVEVPAIIAFQITFCDVIVANTDAPDSIYGGPITDLATDVIAPCEKVLQIG